MSLTKADVISFAAAAEAEPIRRFYSEVLGFRLLGEMDSVLVFGMGQAMLRVSILEEFTPPPYTVLGWSVDDIEVELDILSTQGVVFERFEGLPQDVRGICTFPGGDRVAWFRDPAGNLLSLTQF